MSDYCFENPHLLHEWLLSFSEEDWQLDKLTWLLQKHEGVLRCSLQNKNELAQLLLLLRSQLSWIEHYIEIGICRCGTFYLIDQFLKTFAPKYRSSFAIDGWYAPWTKYGLADYIAKCPWVIGIQKEIQKANSEYELPKQNTFVFIDCDHSYQVTKIAFEKVAEAKLIVLDDVCNKSWEGPNQVYNEACPVKYSKFLINTLDKKLPHGNGFGVLGLNDEQQ